MSTASLEIFSFALMSLSHTSM